MLERCGEADPAAERTFGSALVARDPLDRVTRRVDLEGDRPRSALVNGHAPKYFLAASARREGSSLIFSKLDYSANDVASAVGDVPAARSESVIASREWIPSFW
jgi:hypothetical protein